jgi:hypothetical protein
MLHYQKEQGNTEDVSVFEHERGTGEMQGRI